MIAQQFPKLLVVVQIYQLVPKNNLKECAMNRYSDVYLDKLIDKFILEMEEPIKERETYLVEAHKNEYTFKEIGRV